MKTIPHHTIDFDQSLSPHVPRDTKQTNQRFTWR